MSTELRNAIVAFAHRLADNDSTERDSILAVGGSIAGDESCEKYGISYMPWCKCEICQLIRLTLLEDGVDLSMFPQPIPAGSFDDPEEEDEEYMDDYDNDYDEEDEDFWEEED